MESSPHRPIYNVSSGHGSSPFAADLQWVEAELETAKTLGITVPQAPPLAADEVIE
jgi:hypothetical protein